MVLHLVSTLVYFQAQDDLGFGTWMLEIRATMGLWYPQIQPDQFSKDVMLPISMHQYILESIQPYDLNQLMKLSNDPKNIAQYNEKDEYEQVVQRSDKCFISLGVAIF